jgi:hypothetical protein
VATAANKKPAKAAGKLNLLPAVVGTPSETAQKRAPQKVSESDRIRKSLEAAGFKMTSDPISLGGKLFAEIQPSTTSTDANHRIRQSLEAAGFRVTGDPIQLGRKLFVGIHPRSWKKDVPVDPSLSPQVALAAAGDVPIPAKKGREQNGDQPLLAARIAKKLNDPAGNPTMTVEQVAFAFSVSKQTIYRWIDKGFKQGREGIQLTWAAHGKIPTALVLRVLRPT